VDVKIRMAEEADAPSFAQWITSNPDIPQEDIDAVSACKIPMVLVVEIDGQAEMFMPLLPAVTIGYLGFRPDSEPRKKATARRAMQRALKEFQSRLQIQDAYVFTKAEYPMGKWALRNGFRQKSKDGFTLEKR
jgi:hypothetical protein